MPAPSQRSLRGQDLRRVDLSAVRLAGADLRAVDLREADLRGMDFSGADLRGARMDAAQLAGALLRDCELGEASLEGADLRAADLRRSDGFGLRASWARLEEARLDGAEWRQAELRGAALDRVRGAGVRLDRSDLMGASFGESWLPGVVLDDAHLEEADFRDAFLRRAAMVGVRGRFRCVGADLRRADLLGVEEDCLTGARIEGARRQPVLQRVQVSGEQLQKLYQEWLEQRKRLSERQAEELRVREERRRLREGRQGERRPPLAEGSIDPPAESLFSTESPPPIPMVDRPETVGTVEERESDPPPPPEPAASTSTREPAEPPPDGPVWTTRLQLAWAFVRGAAPDPDSELRLELREVLVRQQAPEREAILVPGEALPEVSHRLELEELEIYDRELRERVRTLLVARDDRPLAQAPDLEGRLWIRQGPSAEEPVKVQIPDRALRPPSAPDASRDADARLAVRRYRTVQAVAKVIPQAVPVDLSASQPDETPQTPLVPTEAAPEAIPAAALVPPAPLPVQLDAAARTPIRRELARQRDAARAAERARLAALAMAEEARKLAEQREQEEERQRLEAQQRAAAAEEQARLLAEEQARRLAEAEAQALLRAEEKARLATEKEERTRLAAEERARVLLEAEERARLAAEERARQVAEAEERARVAAEERARLAAEARQAAEARLQAARRAAEAAAQSLRSLILAEPPSKATLLPREARPDLDLPEPDLEEARLQLRAQRRQEQERARQEQERARREAEATAEAQRQAELRAQAEALAEQRRREEAEAQAQRDLVKRQAEEARKERERQAAEARAEQERQVAEARREHERVAAEARKERERVVEEARLERERVAAETRRERERLAAEARAAAEEKRRRRAEEQRQEQARREAELEELEAQELQAARSADVQRSATEREQERDRQDILAFALALREVRQRTAQQSEAIREAVVRRMAEERESLYRAMAAQQALEGQIREMRAEVEARGDLDATIVHHRLRAAETELLRQNEEVLRRQDALQVRESLAQVDAANLAEADREARRRAAKAERERQEFAELRRRKQKEAGALPVPVAPDLGARFWAAGERKAENDARVQAIRREERQRQQQAMAAFQAEEKQKREAARAEKRRQEQVAQEKRDAEERRRQAWETYERIRERALEEHQSVEEPRLAFREWMLQARYEPPFEGRLEVRGEKVAERQRQLWAERTAPVRKAGVEAARRLRRTGQRTSRTVVEFLWANPEDGPAVVDRIEFEVEVSRRIQEVLRVQSLQDNQGRLSQARRRLLQRQLLAQLQQMGVPAPDQRPEVLAEQVAAERRKRRSQRLQRVGVLIRRSTRSVVGTVPGLTGTLWRRIQPQQLPALGPGMDLRDLQLEDADLRGMDLSGCQLERVSLVGADLRGANLRGCNLREADLSDARLSGADLREADLSAAVLDQTLLDGAMLDGAVLDGAMLDTARGIDPQLRRRLRSTTEQEDRYARATGYLTVGSLAAAVVFYLGIQYQEQTVDLGDLEQAAGEAQRTGRTDEAADNFAQLAARQELPDSKINYLLEAAASAEESKDYAKVLGLLEQALTASLEGPMESTVRLRLAKAQARGNLASAAEEQYRLLLARIDLEPVQQAEALVGLAGVVATEKLAEVKELQAALLKRSATDLERGSVALALADGWSSTGHPAEAQAVVEGVLTDMRDTNERSTLRLRLGRLMVENGDSDGALALYRQLIAGEGTPGLEARLGAAELLMKRGETEEAGSLLTPLLEGSDDDRKARALLVSASIAAVAKKDTEAVALLQQVLSIDGISAQRLDEARLALGRVLVRTDPEAAASFAADNPMLKEEMLLGQARALREAGDRRKARELWVQLSDDPGTSEDARTESQLALADLQMEEGDPDGALVRYENVLAATTTASLRQRIVLGMADALLKLGKLQEAETKYDGLIPVAGPEVAARCQLGLARAAEMRGQLDRATRLYQEVSRQDGPGSLEALLSLGELRERNGDLAGAVESLRLARTRVGAETDRRTEADIALARVLQRQGSPEAATLYAQLLEAPDPEVRVQARLAVGEQRLSDEPAVALKMFEEAEDQATRPDQRADARAGWMRAMVLLDRSDAAVERARAWLAAETDRARKGELALAAVKALRAEGRGEEAIALGERYGDEGGFELAMELAGVYRDSGNLDGAIRSLQGAVAKEPEDKVWQAETLLDALLLAGRWTEADAACTRLAALPGGEAASRFGRSRLLREQGKMEEALSMLADLDDPRVPMEKAELLQALGRDNEAEVLFRRMILATDLEQRSAGRVGLGRILLERGDAVGALAALDQEAVDPGYALTAAEVRGESLLALGRVAEAQAVYNALDGDAEARVVRALGLGDCALAEENPVEARSQFEAALSSVDRFYQAQALAGLVRTAAEAGDPAKAGELLQKLRSEYPDHEDAIAAARAGISGQ